MNDILRVFNEIVLQSRIKDLPEGVQFATKNSAPVLTDDEIATWEDNLRDGGHIDIEISICARSHPSPHHLLLEKWKLYFINSPIDHTYANGLGGEVLDSLRIALLDFIKRSPASRLLHANRHNPRNSCSIQYGSETESLPNVISMETYDFPAYQTLDGVFKLGVSFLYDFSMILDSMDFLDLAPESFKPIMIFNILPSISSAKIQCYCQEDSLSQMIRGASLRSSLFLHTKSVSIPSSPPSEHHLSTSTYQSIPPHSNTSRDITVPLKTFGFDNAQSPPPSSLSFMVNFRKTSSIPSAIQVFPLDSATNLNISTSLPSLSTLLSTKPLMSGYNFTVPKNKTCKELFPRPGTPTPSRDFLSRSAPLNIPKVSSATQIGFKTRSKTNGDESLEKNERDILSLSMEDDFEYPEENEEEEERYLSNDLYKNRRRKSLGSETEIKHVVDGAPLKNPQNHSNSTTIRRTTLKSPTSPGSEPGSFVGSFQESLLSGHMGHTANSVYSGFIADLGASGKNCLPPHIKIPFSATFYHIEPDTPYVGTITLSKKGYQVPEKGMIQLTLINPTLTPFKTFLIKYDVHDMPISSRTFLRYIVTSSRDGSHPIVRYAVHLKFICPRKTKRKIYLYKDIRIVFAHRTPDDEEIITTSCESPENPKYFPFTPRKKEKSPTKDLKKADRSDEVPFIL